MRKDEKTVSCEVSYLPLSGKTTEQIEDILSVITNSGVDYEIGYYRTILRGSMDKVMSLITELYNKADSFGDFVIDVRFSNTCGH